MRGLFVCLLMLFVYVCGNPNAKVSEITSCEVCDRLDLSGSAGQDAWVRASLRDEIVNRVFENSPVDCPLFDF